MSPLSLRRLEDRAVPATFSYSVALQKLTVTAGQGEQLTVSQLADLPTGYISVATGAGPVFASDTAKAPVRHLNVVFTAVDSGNLTIGDGVVLGGNLSVAGAKLNQFLTLAGKIGGNVTYAPGALAVDDVTVAGTARIGGNLTLALSAGDNIAHLGGAVLGNLLVTGGGGADTVELISAAGMDVGGSATIQLGNGVNDVRGVGIGGTFVVGGNLTYTGGTDNDHFRPDSTGISVRVGGDAKFLLGTGSAFDANSAEFEGLSVGRSLSITAGAGGDLIAVTGRLEVGTSVTANLGAGANSFTATTAGNLVGTGFNYTGLGGTDVVSLDNLAVGRNLTAALGEGTGQSFAGGPGGLEVYGTLTLSAGGGADTMTLTKAYVGWNLSVLTGAGDDTVNLDDLSVAGLTTLDLGLGADGLNVELNAAATGVTSFGSTVTIKGGDGVDTVRLSDDGDATTIVRFGGKLNLLGGGGTDVLRNGTGNAFLVSGGTEDFETGDL